MQFKDVFVINQTACANKPPGYLCLFEDYLLCLFTFSSMSYRTFRLLYLPYQLLRHCIGPMLRNFVQSQTGSGQGHLLLYGSLYLSLSGLPAVLRSYQKLCCSTLGSMVTDSFSDRCLQHCYSMIDSSPKKSSNNWSMPLMPLAC